MVETLFDFISRCYSAGSYDELYYIFEVECTDKVRRQICAIAPPGTDNPLRYAMHLFGFTEF